MLIKKWIALAFLTLSINAYATAPKATVSEITFSVKASPQQQKKFPDKIVPWASIKNAESDAARLIDAKLKVLSVREATIVIDYPVRQPVQFKITSNTGFTKAELLIRIGQIYRQIYKEEETSSTIKTVPRGERKGLINRNTTDGKYGIWGHDIEDLDLSSATISCKRGQCIIELGIES